MPQLTRNGLSLYYEDHGTGPALLLSHGYTATTRMWEGQVEALSDRYRVITWDMRGHGRSDYPSDPGAYSEAHTVADMAALLDHCGTDEAIIGGLSLGGYMSLAFHLRHPQRTRALLLFDTGPGYKNDEARDGWNLNAEKRARAFEERGLEALNSSPEVAASRHRNAEGLALAARGMLVQKDSRVIESLPSIEVPTLIVAGTEDKPFLAATDYMANKIPGARKALIEDAGHASNIDQPEAFNAVVEGFLSQLSQDRQRGARPT